MSLKKTASKRTVRKGWEIHDPFIACFFFGKVKNGCLTAEEIQRLRKMLAVSESRPTRPAPSEAHDFAVFIALIH